MNLGTGQEDHNLDGSVRVFGQGGDNKADGESDSENGYHFRMMDLKTGWNVSSSILGVSALAGSDRLFPVQRCPAALVAVHDVVDFLVIELGRHRRACVPSELRFGPRVGFAFRFGFGAACSSERHMVELQYDSATASP